MSQTDDRFEEFWRAYPRKVAKLEALKAWRQMTREYNPDDIIAGLQANLPVLLRKEKQFVKHPASWLRAGCWMDECETARQQTGRRNIIDAALDRIAEPHDRLFGRAH